MRVIIVVLALALLNLQALFGEAADLHAGAAKAEITPLKWPVHLVGSFSERLADKAWDPLYARAVVIDDGNSAVALCVVDSCYCPRSLFDDAKQRIAERTGIPIEHMLFSATHTHSAPPSRDRRGVKADGEYVERVTSGIVKSVETAYSQMVPAEVGWGMVQVPEEVHNRRWFMKEGGIVANPFGETDDVVRMNPPRGKGLLDRPAGPTDPDVHFLSLRTTDGAPIALLANYSLHYVGGIPAGGVSADYFGAFCDLIEERLQRDDGPSVIGIMSNGTSGDVNNINFRNPQPRKKPFEQMRHVAKLVADRILDEYPSVDHRNNITVDGAQKLLTLQKRRPTDAQVERAHEFLAADDESSLPPRAKAYARWTVQLAEPPYEEELVLQALRIGEVGIAAIPCETFAEIGLELRDKSPLVPTFTIELANGHYGYLPTPRQHAWGGYETWLGTNILEFEASEKIKEVVLDLLTEVAAP